MKNTLENKEKFFAQYYSVPCIENENWIWRSKDKFKDLPYGSDITDCYAVLKSLSSITDEDAIEVAKNLEFENELNYIDTAKEWCVSIENNIRKVFSDKPFNYIGCFDFLRSKGYALPYMGLSVEKQVEYGWIKLF